MTTRHMTLCDPDFVRRIAGIIGPSSAAQQALDDYERRKGAGERVHIFQDVARPIFWVGPMPEETAAALTEKDPQP